MKDFKVTFTLKDWRKDTPKNKPLTVYAFSKFNSNKRIFKSTGEKLSKMKFDRHSKKNEWPSKLNEIKSKLELTYARIKLQDPTAPSHTTLKEIWEAYQDPEHFNKKDISPYVIERLFTFIDRSTASYDHKRKANQVAKRLNDYSLENFKDSKEIEVRGERLKISTIKFIHLKEQYLKEYFYWIEHELGLSSGTRATHKKMIKAVIDEVKDELPHTYAIEKIAITEVNEPYLALSFDEIEMIRRHRPKDLKELLVKHMFCFMAYTGIIPKDLLKQKKGFVSGGFINYMRSKTESKSPKPVAVTLHKYNKAVLEEYISDFKDYYSNDDNEDFFPPIRKDELNSIIKKVAKDAGISEEIPQGKNKPRYECICSYVGRVSYNTLLKKIDLSNFICEEELGHSHSSVNEKHYTQIDKYERSKVVNEAFDEVEERLKKWEVQTVTRFADVEY